MRPEKLGTIIHKTNEKLRGHYQYFGVSDNTKMLNKYMYEVTKLIYKWLNRRSQRRSYTWEEFNKMLKKYPILKPKICVSMFDMK